MKERPILLSTPRVRAVLEGRMTQMRRIGKLQSEHYVELGVEYSNHATQGKQAVATYAAFPGQGTARWGICACPYGVPGDHLWVRETWKPTGMFSFMKPRETKACGRFAYRADAEQLPRDSQIPWRPAIFMPRWASRITLKITAIRVQRLQDITEEDAKAEGAGEEFWPSERVQLGKSRNHRAGFAALWKSINGPDSWGVNPWVWCVSFERIK